MLRLACDGLKVWPWVFCLFFLLKWLVVAGVLVFLDGIKISGVVKLLLCIQADSFNMGFYSDAERRDVCPRVTEEGSGAP